MTSVVATGKSDAWVAGLACGPGCPGSRSLVVRRWNGGKWLTVAPPKGLTSAKNLLNGALHGTGKHWPVAKFPRFSQITGTEVFSAKNAWAFGISGSAAPALRRALDRQRVAHRGAAARQQARR